MCFEDKALLNLCKEGHLPKVLHHLKQDKFVDCKDEIGTTALQICAARGWEEAVLILIEKGSDLDSTNFVGLTPLMLAARNGHGAVVEQLVLAGSDPTTRNCFGWDALSLAVASLNENIINILIPLARRAQLSLALIVSCQAGCVSITKLLIDHHANVNIQFPTSGITPLMMAASEGHNSVIEMLLSFGADPNIKNAVGMTALDIAISCGHSDVRKTLAQATKWGRSIPKLIASPTYDPCTPSLSSECASLITNIMLHTSPNSHFYPSHVNNFNETSEGKHLSLPPQSTAPPLHMCISPTNVALLTPTSDNPCFQFPQSFHFSATQNCLLLSPGPMPYPSSPMIPAWIFSVSPTPQVHKSLPEKQQTSFAGKCRVSRWWTKFRIRCKGKHKLLGTYKPHKDGAIKAADHDLKGLMKTLRLETLLPLLQSQEVDVPTFLTLSDEDLKVLGVEDDIYRAKVLLKIQQISGRS